MHRKSRRPDRTGGGWSLYKVGGLLLDVQGGDHLGAAGAQGGVLGVGAHQGVVLPAALALLTLGGGDGDGQLYLFYQGSPDNGKSWYITKTRLVMKDGLPTIAE